MVEIKFEAQTDHKDPFNDLTLDVVFENANRGPATKRRVPAFWAGGGMWKVRYASDKGGSYRYRTECSDVKDRGLHGVEGEVFVDTYRGNNELYVHGPLKVDNTGRFLVHL